MGPKLDRLEDPRRAALADEPNDAEALDHRPSSWPWHWPIGHSSHTRPQCGDVVGEFSPQRREETLIGARLLGPRGAGRASSEVIMCRLRGVAPKILGDESLQCLVVEA
jgi:hypothetical protein